MKSYQVAAFGEPLVEAQSADHAPQGTEVALRVSACGVCHSDIHLWEGFFDLGGGKKSDLSRSISLPHTLGHEVVGEVAAVGPEAESVTLGDTRLVFPWIGCGTCSVCLADEEHLCNRPRNLGVNVPGGYADHVLVPHPRYLLEIGDLPRAAAATLACSGLTAYSALRKIEGAGAGDPVLIIGAGGVGLAGIQIAASVLGVKPIVADIDAAKREAALAAGAAEAIDPAAEGAGRALMKASGGIAAAIDFVGAQASAQFGLDSLRKGGKLVIVGLFGGAITIPVPFFPLRALTVMGSVVGSLRELRELVVLARERKFDLVPIETRALGQAQATLDDLKSGHIVGRVVLTP